MAEKIGSFIIDLIGETLNAEEIELLQHPLVGGVILFARNYRSRAQLESLCQALRAVRKTPLLIMVDQEGGRVQRFIHEFTKLPAMAVFGELYQKNPSEACERAKDCGWLMAMELLTVGIDISLAPVLDLNKHKNTVIGSRAFAADPAIVSTLATAFIAGMREAGMAATGKHFPGHGEVSADSHLLLPQDDRTLTAILHEDLLPFTTLTPYLSAIMAAHIIFPQVDTSPVGFSRKWLQDILRTQLGFQGVIFSDDLNMAGADISSQYEVRALTAREAGCDFFMLCNNRPGVIQVLDHLPYASHQVPPEKWQVLKSQYLAEKKSSMDTIRWQAANQFLQTVSSAT